MSDTNNTTTTETDSSTVNVAEQTAVMQSVPEPALPQYTPGYKPTLFDYVRGYAHSVYWNAKRTLKRVNRLFPRLVWYGQEVDVILTFVEHDPLSDFIDQVPNQVSNNDNLYEVEKLLQDMNIRFDVGYGSRGALRGRDWFLDYSLRGPLRVKFVGHTEASVVRQ